MARYLLVEFDDNAEAEAFAAMTNEQEEGTTMRTIGMFGKPTIFCECEDKRIEPVMGQKYGWRVHAKCGRPPRNHWHTAKNLLHPDERIKFRQFFLNAFDPRPRYIPPVEETKDPQGGVK